jgi:acylphosphatase
MPSYDDHLASSLKRTRVLISGEVQGVYFRDTCRRMAARRGVNGWVRNLRDGRVEAVFEGTGDAVDTMVAWARRGPSTARVAEVAVHPEPPEGLTGFAVR